MLDGLPNLQDLGKLLIGENVPELLSCDLQSESGAQATIKDGDRPLRERDATSSRATSCRTSSTTPRSTSTGSRPRSSCSPRSGSRTICNRRWAPPTDARRASRKAHCHDRLRLPPRLGPRHPSCRPRRRSQPRVPAVRSRRRDAVRPLRRLRDPRAVRCARTSRRRLRSSPLSTRPGPSRWPEPKPLPTIRLPSFPAAPPCGAGPHARHLALAQGPARRSSPASRRASRRSPTSTSIASARSKASARRCRRAPRSCRRGATLLSREIGKLKGQGGDASAPMADVAAIGAELERSAERLATIQLELNAQLMALPNLPDASVPVGADENANVEVRRWGMPRQFEFTPRDHVDVGAPLGLDLDTGVKLSGRTLLVPARPGGAAASRARPVHARRADRGAWLHRVLYAVHRQPRGARGHRPAAQVQERHVLGLSRRRGGRRRRHDGARAVPDLDLRDLAHQQRSRRARSPRRACRSSSPRTRRAFAPRPAAPVATPAA